MRDVYGMLGKDSYGQAQAMFTMMDKVRGWYEVMEYIAGYQDGDNKITEEEFIRASMADVELNRMLTTSVL